jgi:hypothetical protein
MGQKVLNFIKILLKKVKIWTRWSGPLARLIF